MYLTKLEFDKAKNCYQGTIGFGKVPVALAQEGEKFVLKIADREFCKLMKNNKGNFLGNWSLMRLVLKVKTPGVLTLMAFDKEEQTKPEGYKEAPF